MPINITLTKIFFYLTFVSIFFPLWQINAGLLINPYQVFGLFFLMFFIFKNLYFTQKIYVKKSAYLLICFMLLGVVTKLAGIIPLFYLGQSNFDYVAQFSKGIIFTLYNFILFSCMLIYVLSLDKKIDYKLLEVFQSIIIFACFYQFTQLFLLVFIGIDLDGLVWPNISYNFSLENLPLQNQGLGLGDQLTFYRAGSIFGNPNVFAAFLIFGISIFSLRFLFEKDFKYLFFLLIVCMSLLITLSRSGIASSLICFFLIFIFYFNFFIKNFKKHILIFFALLMTPLFIYSDIFVELFKIRFLNLNPNDLFGTRADLWIAGFEIIKENPVFGVGLNNSPIALDNYLIVNTTGRNLHNYYIENIVNHGLLGFILIFSIWVFLLSNFKKNNLFSSIIFFTLIPILVLSFSTNVIDQAFISLPLLIFFSMFTKDDVDILHKGNLK